jgi:hypothetical protein
MTKLTPLLLFLLAACRPQLNEEMIQEAVKTNTQAYTSKRYDDCMQRHLVVASRRVDSMVRVYIQENLITQDSLIPPVRPAKPLISEERQPIDSMQVQPFLKEI